VSRICGLALLRRWICTQLFELRQPVAAVAAVLMAHVPAGMSLGSTGALAEAGYRAVGLPCPSDARSSGQTPPADVAGPSGHQQLHALWRCRSSRTGISSLPVRPIPHSVLTPHSRLPALGAGEALGS
jgi:hypothetical protein